MDFVCFYASPLGPVILAGDGEALTGLWFEGQKHAAFPDPVRVEGDLPVFRRACRWLDIYFSGRDPGFTPPLRLSGSPFRRAVWEMLLTVPFGRTVTYGEMASRLAGWNGPARVSPRAVGGAVARNPVSLIVPCHRVVAADGLGGYAAGPARKLALLSLEKAVFPPPVLPPAGNAGDPLYRTGAGCRMIDIERDALK